MPCPLQDLAFIVSRRVEASSHPGHRRHFLLRQPEHRIPSPRATRRRPLVHELSTASAFQPRRPSSLDPLASAKEPEARASRFPAALRSPMQRTRCATDRMPVRLPPRRSLAGAVRFGRPTYAPEQHPPRRTRLLPEQSSRSRTPGSARSSQRTFPCASLRSVGTVSSERVCHGLSTASTLLRAATRLAVMPLDIPVPLDTVATPLLPGNPDLAALAPRPSLLPTSSEEEPDASASDGSSCPSSLLPEGSNRSLDVGAVRTGLPLLARERWSRRPPAAPLHTRQPETGCPVHSKVASRIAPGRWSRLDCEALLHRRVRCDATP